MVVSHGDTQVDHPSVMPEMFLWCTPHDHRMQGYQTSGPFLLGASQLSLP
jgi:hypothetical protein